jgi:hypothetical protein
MHLIVFLSFFSLIFFSNIFLFSWMKLEKFLNKQSQWRINNFTHNYMEWDFIHLFRLALERWISDGFSQNMYMTKQKIAHKYSQCVIGMKRKEMNLSTYLKIGSRTLIIHLLMYTINFYCLSALFCATALLCTFFRLFCGFATCTRLVFNLSIKQSWSYSRSLTGSSFSSR